MKGRNDFSETLIRAKFEELYIDLFRKTMKPVEQVFKDANLRAEDIYKAQQPLKEYFNKEPRKVSTTTQPSHAVLLSRVFDPVARASVTSSSSMSAGSRSPTTLSSLRASCTCDVSCRPIHGGNLVSPGADSPTNRAQGDGCES
ncbi:hypothetical protein FOMPIDRAFT_1022994 [Fomitopsis schrenkii]|uniref:Uncharacterized protein n=1 Tax=Fomitopsis schrenkii TaxID=2126942 RepID=S8FKJ7_FOMSC|nr:hypothetical protein FOMPIDRAFT_1022994 [Fomitopsis schrenkii]